MLPENATRRQRPHIRVSERRSRAAIPVLAVDPGDIAESGCDLQRWNVDHRPLLEGPACRIVVGHEVEVGAETEPISRLALLWVVEVLKRQAVEAAVLVAQELLLQRQRLPGVQGNLHVDPVPLLQEGVIAFELLVRPLDDLDRPKTAVDRVGQRTASEFLLAARVALEATVRRLRRVVLWQRRRSHR